MKILKATFQNFLTLSDACLELDDRGLLLITGKNDDDTSANSNGAGKSSLVDCICWALY
ncbi:AAA family ATPase, partial [Acinetobacter baumannii]|nr:AAA family ATPase [Acinetobacter baumannii]